ncbi:MAG TPA: sialidase family protein [Candidatus Angelobacter sp.]|nr:sialidase family protein [Candidatus Angelobacter sp.]
MKAQTFIVVTVLVLCVTLTPAHALPAAGPNVDITASGDSAERQQVEPTIAVDPHNPSLVVAGAQDYRLLSTGGHRWHGYYRSIDGGQTWSVTLLPGYPGDNSPQGLASPLHGVYSSTSDPVLAFDRSGNVYYVGITAAGTLTDPMGFNLFIAKFINDGADYAFTTLLPRSLYNLADKPWITVDTSGGPSDGTVYVTYDTFAVKAAVDAGVALVRSTDGGVTYSQPVLAIKQGFFSGVAVDAQGRVFVSSLTPGRSRTSSNIAVAVSTEHGLDFHGHEIATGVALLPSPLPGNSFRTFTTPQIVADNHGVYLVWDDYARGNANVMFTESTDGASTWTPPLRVNDVNLGQHFFSTIAVSSGTISIAWYDSRLAQLSSGTITALDVFYAESKDGGLSFSANLRITSASFNPNIVERADFGDPEIFMGDYIQIAASPAAAHVLWADNRDACSNIVPFFGCTNQDIFTSTITI